MASDRTLKPGQDRTDWTVLRAMSEDEIERIAAADDDNPATVADAEWANAAIGLPALKTSIHGSFDRDVVEFFKRGGRGYQTHMNAVLRRYMEMQQGKKTGL